jgi:hypothetical protein
VKSKAILSAAGVVVVGLAVGIWQASLSNRALHWRTSDQVPPGLKKRVDRLFTDILDDTSEPRLRQHYEPTYTSENRIGNAYFWFAESIFNSDELGDPEAANREFQRQLESTGLSPYEPTFDDTPAGEAKMAAYRTSGTNPSRDLVHAICNPVITRVSASTDNESVVYVEGRCVLRGVTVPFRLRFVHSETGTDKVKAAYFLHPGMYG